MQDPYTLVIALDDSGSALGSLYVDDGRSFAHEGGQFSKTEFSFEKGVLSSKVRSIPACIQSVLQARLIGVAIFHAMAVSGVAIDLGTKFERGTKSDTFLRCQLLVDVALTCIESKAPLLVVEHQQPSMHDVFATSAVERIERGVETSLCGTCRW